LILSPPTSRASLLGFFRELNPVLDREDRAKDLLARNPHRVVDIGENGWLDELTANVELIKAKSVEGCVSDYSAAYSLNLHHRIRAVGRV
jgi:hypothetical protein